jgi:hypothetical protein
MRWWFFKASGALAIGPMQLPFVRFRCRLARARLEGDQDPHNQEIVIGDPMVSAIPRHHFVALHVVLDQHPENSLRPRLPLSLYRLNPARQSIN